MSTIETALRASDPMWGDLDSRVADDEHPLRLIVGQLLAVVGDATPLFIQTRHEDTDDSGGIKIEVFAIWENLVTSTTCAEGRAGTTVASRHSLRSVQLRGAPFEGTNEPPLEAFLSFDELGDVRVPSNRDHAPLRESLAALFPLLMVDLAK